MIELVVDISALNDVAIDAQCCLVTTYLSFYSVVEVLIKHCYIAYGGSMYDMLFVLFIEITGCRQQCCHQLWARLPVAGYLHMPPLMSEYKHSARHFSSIIAVNVFSLEILVYC